VKRYPVVAAGDLPKTGDPSMLGAWIALLGASCAGMKLRRKK
jgi:LPXTG-motif cell wall-anchored protein